MYVSLSPQCFTLSPSSLSLFPFPLPSTLSKTQWKKYPGMKINKKNKKINQPLFLSALCPTLHSLWGEGVPSSPFPRAQHRAGSQWWDFSSSRWDSGSSEHWIEHHSLILTPGLPHGLKSQPPLSAHGQQVENEHRLVCSPGGRERQMECSGLLLQMRKLRFKARLTLNPVIQGSRLQLWLTSRMGRTGQNFLPVEEGSSLRPGSRHAPAPHTAGLHPPLTCQVASWSLPAGLRWGGEGEREGGRAGGGTRAPLCRLLGPGCIYSASVNRRCLEARSVMTT